MRKKRLESWNVLPVHQQTASEKQKQTSPAAVLLSTIHRWLRSPTPYIFTCSFLPSTLTHIPVPALVQVSGFFPPPGQWCGRWHQHPLTLHAHEEKTDQRQVRHVKTNPLSPISPTSSPSERRKMRENTPVMNSLKLPGFSLFIPRKRSHNIFIQVASTR